jgi:hypothetical protein
VTIEAPANTKELVVELLVERDIGRRHLATVAESFHDKDWRHVHRGNGVYPEDHLWWATAGSSISTTPSAASTAESTFHNSTRAGNLCAWMATSVPSSKRHLRRWCGRLTSCRERSRPSFNWPIGPVSYLPPKLGVALSRATYMAITAASSRCLAGPPRKLYAWRRRKHGGEFRVTHNCRSGTVMRAPAGTYGVGELTVPLAEEELPPIGARQGRDTFHRPSWTT